MLQIFFVFAIFTLSMEAANSADAYPVSGAWALVQPSSPQLQVRACKTFDRLGLERVTGDAIGGGELIVFNGPKRHDFGGYADDVTPNISTRRLSDKRYEIVDRWTSDGEGGVSPGPKRRRYTLTVLGPDAIEIKEGRYNPARYVRCGSPHGNTAEGNKAAVSGSTKVELPPSIAVSIEDARQLCGFKSIPPGAVRSIDLNGDGIHDYIIDYGAMGCRGFCGSAGCLHELWVSKDADFVRSLSENMHGVERIEPRESGNDVIVAMHGSSCGRVGSNICRFRLHWDKSKLTRQQITK